MHGWVGFGAEDFNAGFYAGKRAHTACGFKLTITMNGDNGAAVGEVHCDSLGGTLRVNDGRFVLLEHVGDRNARRMRYHLPLRDEHSRPLLFEAFKLIEDDAGYDVWADTTTLFTTLYAGDVADEDKRLARGILRLNHRDFARQLTTMRGDRKSLTALGRSFSTGLLGAYARRAPVPSRPDYPVDPRFAGREPGAWHDLPERPGLRRRILGLDALDGVELTLHNIRGAHEPDRGPVLLAHGAGVRANILYGAPVRATLVDALVAAGYDPWLVNWRGSIDLPNRDWTVASVAANDHPAAVRRVLDETGESTLRAVVHCQGSTSFCLALARGDLPEVTHVVSNAVSLHVDVPLASAIKQHVMIPPARVFVRGVDPQWAIRTQSWFPTAFARATRMVRHECDSEVCSAANYCYGVGPDIVWRHELLDEATHDWLAREWGYTPLSFFKEMARYVRHRTILPEPLLRKGPRTDARIMLMAGSENRCFLPSSQHRTLAWLEETRPAGTQSYVELPGFSHIDPFFGRGAENVVYPAILEALAA